MKRVRIGSLVIGDLVATTDGGRVRITHSGPDKQMVYPYRRSAERVRVPGWYLIWRAAGEREVGGVFDPDDEVMLA